MGFRDPITTAVDQTARDAAAAAQSTASAAQSTASAALTTADGKNTTYVQATAPAAPAAGFVDGDQWVDTTDHLLKTWTGGEWAAVQFGTDALIAGSITAGLIAADAIGTDQLAAGTVLTGEITTGDPTGGRMHLYEASDANGRWGVLEFDDPAADTAGALTAKTNAGAGGSVQGSLTTLKGISSNGVVAPEIDLDVETSPTSGYWPVLRLKAGTGGHIATDTTIEAAASPLTITKAARPSLFTGTAFEAYSDAHAGSVYGAELYKDAGGLVVIEALMAAASSVSAGPSSPILTLPVGYRPRHQLFRVTVAQGGVLAIVDVDTNGVINYSTGPALSAGQYVALYLTWLSTDLL